MRGPMKGEKRVLKAVMKGLVWRLCIGLEVMPVSLEAMADNKMVSVDSRRRWWLCMR